MTSTPVAPLPSNCRKCGERLDNATATTRGEPIEPGDISVCAYCGELSMLSEAGQLEPFTPEYEAGIPQDVWRKIRKIQEKIRTNPIKARRPN